MDELILALLSGVGEILLEAVLQVIGEALTALIIRSVQNLAGDVRNVDRESITISPVFAAAGYLLLGVGFGAISVHIFPHHMVQPSRIHGISLIVSPFITGSIMRQIGLARRRKGANTVQIESFWYGFTFALGVALIRFFFVM
ncbi:hypothetical protein [Terracidiphilus gabretensis]|uniref:hypothetical protein n=1 Tax=Terracidiphilus gabretensis TaxID=1577687 RepID=UPI00071BF32D|nr:hypothetical protein [Terracidiphilus gabretensis]